MSKSVSSRVDDLLASVTGELLGKALALEDDTLRIERILLDLVRPDPVQPRRVMPESILIAFHNNCMTSSQALRELVSMVQIAARQHGRPFHSVLELLPNGNDERDDEPAVSLTPDLVSRRVSCGVRVWLRPQSATLLPSVPVLWPPQRRDRRQRRNFKVGLPCRAPQQHLRPLPFPARTLASFQHSPRPFHFLFAQHHRKLLLLSAHELHLFLGAYSSFSYLLDGLLALTRDISTRVTPKKLRSREKSS